MGLFDRQDDEANRPAILKELDSFNDAPGFGMMGILEQQMQQESGTEEKTQDVPAKEEKEEKTPEVDYEKVYAPLNTSIQELGSRMDTRLSQVERLAAQRPQVQQQEQTPAYDPEEPVFRGQYEQTRQSIEQKIHQNGLDNIYTRAVAELAEFNRSHPDSKISIADVRRTWDQALANGQTDVNQWRAVDWSALYEAGYSRQVAPERDKELATLRKENEELKKQVSKKSSTGQQQQRQEQLSPAVARTSTRSIESPTNVRDDDDVTHLPSFKKGKSFKSYANELKRSGKFNF
jgi:hypothetical protein